jgi:hypothetical protein
MTNKIIILTVIFLLQFAKPGINAQKFIPPDGKVLLILGQDLGAVGGFSSPNDNGYADFFTDIPAGITTYTSLSSLNGLKSLDNWGSGDVCAQCILDNPRYDNSSIVIGLYIVNQLDDIISGSLDTKISELGKWIQDAKRPVFLRIGYEFNGSWNNYEPTKYKAAFRKICDELKQMGVTNFASVWQSEGSGTANQLLAWYPGDEYVDWMGYSHFTNKGNGIIELAKSKSKPVMIAEATPQKDLKSENGDLVWTNWFQPLFTQISNNDVIKALAYINVDWESQPMWVGQGWGDSRIQVNEIVSTNWKTEIKSGKWLFGDENLFNLLSYFPQGSVLKEAGKKEFTVTRENDQLVINNDSKVNSGANVQILSLRGNMIWEKKFSGKQIVSDNFTLPLGLYLVKITNGTAMETHKFFWF